MKIHHRLTDILKYTLVGVTAAVILILGFMWISQEYRWFRHETQAIRQQMLQTEKESILTAVNEIIDYINFKRSQTEERLKYTIKSRTYEAVAIANNLYQQYKDKLPRAEIEKMVKDALRPIRYNNNRGYYFATRLDGVEKLFADRPEMEEQDLIDMKDTQGKFVIKEMINIARQQGEGFIYYQWTKPNRQGSNFPKIAFVKYFKPFNWFFGTGEYLDDVEGDIKQEVLSRLRVFRFGKGQLNYIYAFTFDGITLAHYQKKMIGKELEEIALHNGPTLVQQAAQISRAPDGGFLEYLTHCKINAEGKPVKKLGYFKNIPGWDWVIATGIYTDEIEKVIETEKEKLTRRITTSIRNTVIILLIFVIITLLISRFITRHAWAGIKTFSSFFEQAATTSTRIDLPSLDFHEFKTMATGANRMIDERERIENDLKKSMENLSKSQAIAHMGSWEWELATDVMYWSEEGYRLLGLPPTTPKIDFKFYLNRVHPDDRPFFKEIIAAAIKQNQPFDIQHRLFRLDSSLRVHHTQAEIVINPDGQVERLIGIAWDITEYKKTEESLHRHEERFKNFVDSSTIGIFCYQLIPPAELDSTDELNEAIFNSRCSECNDTFARMLGNQKEKIFETPLYQVMPDTPENHKYIDHFIKNGYRVSLGLTHEIDARGNDRYFSKSMVGTIQHNRLVEIWGTQTDFTDLKLAQEESARLIMAIEQLVELIVITDANGFIQYVNPAFEQCTGYSRNEVIGKKPSFLKSGQHPNEYYAELWKTITSGQVWQGNFINKNKRGTLYTEAATISPIRDSSGVITNFVAVKRDVTREIEMEKQLFQMQKMDAIGTLAGGVAHDFNNILSAIIGYSEIALYEVAPNSDAADNISQVLTAGHRAKELVKQILSFSRISDEQQAPVRLSRVVREAVKLIRASLPASIEISLDLDGEDDYILGDTTRLHQVLINLCTNASHAMENQGLLEIIIKHVTLDGSNITLLPELKPGHYIQLIVRDSGKGMDPATLERIFDPYFTTKEIGKGTGLGLTTVHGIVRSHHGAIKVKSEVGHGSTFEIFFPAVESSGQVVTEETVTRLPRALSLSHILLVDDEEMLTDMGEQMLKLLGYRVTSKNDPRQALEYFRSHAEDIDLVLTDMTMPAMTGDRLIREARNIRPHIPVILCTGFSEQMNAAQAQELGIDYFLLKPLSLRQLGTTVRDALKGANQDPLKRK